MSRQSGTYHPGPCRTGKVRYRDLLDAKVALANTALASTRGIGKKKRHESNLYYCPMCRGYHLTSRKRGQR